MCRSAKGPATDIVSKGLVVIGFNKMAKQPLDDRTSAFHFFYRFFIVAVY
jgi:hypothetical protein